ncbi:urate oxidase [Mumia zhuanghuii]|uniref:Uricase n=2 Tax=Mumia TaxID=1546255 RepID=A0ABW1QLS2_9ACTN|nr:MULTISPECIES: urate oxidase [Mumia]KAA1422190.1 urate oxidase [Mumia zhuanghuii]
MADPRASYTLGPNQYGKAEVRLVRVDRDTLRHRVTDLSVTSQLAGDFTAAHTSGDNAHVVATDTQKNTVYAFARDGVGAPETFLLRLADHFTGSFAWVTGGRWAAEQYAWSRIPTSTAPEGHDHAFSRDGAETRTALVVRDGDATTVLAGLKDLVVLKSTGSEFAGFPRDEYTTLADTDDRILATSVTARWRYAGSVPASFGADRYDSAYATVRAAMLDAFAATYSLALQQTLYAMGAAVLDSVPEIAEIRFSMPNRHHFLVDLAPFGLDNPGEVFYAADRPYGLIEAAVLRDDADAAEPVWAAAAGFC